MGSKTKVDSALEDIIQCSQNQWGIFTRAHFERQYGPSTDAGYEMWLRDIKRGLSPILEKYLRSAPSVR